MGEQALSEGMEDLSGLAKTTQDVYERQADAFDRQRPKGLHERIWLDPFLNLVSPGGLILDLGCGAGDPIAGHMTAEGFQVVGTDASNAMLRLAREKFPEGDWRLQDMRALELPERFDGIVAWNSFFHLTRDEQRQVLDRIGNHLKPGGALMLTVGGEDGEVAGVVGGEPIYHSSLAPDEYRRRLTAHGINVIEFVVEDERCDGQTVLLAVKQNE